MSNLCSDHAFPSALRPVRLAFALAALGLFGGCAWQEPLRHTYPAPWENTEAEPEPEPAAEAAPAAPARAAEHSRFALAKDSAVIGQLLAFKVRNGDTLPDIARHYGLGHEEIAAANPELDIWAPAAGQRALLPLRFVLPEAARKGIVVNLAAMRLFSFTGKDGNTVVTYPVGIGKEGRSTPLGDMRVARKAVKPTWHVPDSIRRDHALKGDPLPASVPPGPDNPLGEYAMYLDKPRYLIHGTDKPYSIGIRASNGCLRLYPENIDRLFKATPVNTPVRIVNQPYLAGWHQGQLYVEAHPPHEELNSAALKNALRAKLKEIERKQGKNVDWAKVESTLQEARGVPVPVLQGAPGIEQLVALAPEVAAPEKLQGRPEAPPVAAGIGWYIQALITSNPVTAQRTAAVLNHLGPQIPARVTRGGDEDYQVLAGPYPNEQGAQKAAQRMLVDLELKSKLLSPNEQVSAAPVEQPAPQEAPLRVRWVYKPR